MRWRTILLVLCTVPSLLKAELRPIRAYTTADGLAADHVDRIVPDSRGFLWFCTPEGLSRFDGYRFVTYGVKEGLASRAVSILLETRAGEYFLGTTLGVSRMNPTRGGSRFATYAPEPEPSGNVVRDLRDSGNGRIWCATRHGLFEWSSATGFRRIPLSLPPKVGINSIVQDPGGDLWVGTDIGIYRLGERGVEQTLAVQDGLPGNWVEMLLVDSRGKLWAALRGGLALISRQPAGGWRVEKVLTESSGLRSWDVKAVLQASDGTFWVGTTLGITRFRLVTGEPVLLENLSRAQGLSDRSITALAEDQAGNIWAGTEGAGVMRIDRVGFTTFHEQDGLPTDRVFSVREDRAGELLAVTAGKNQATGAIVLFDGATFHDVTPRLYGERASWGWDQVLLQSRTGEWWAATKDGLCRYPAMKAMELRGRDPLTCYSRDDEIFRIFEDSRGGVWASGQSRRGTDELMRWDPITSTVFHFPAPKLPGGPYEDLVNAFAEDRQGNVWMGLHIGGLYRYDGRTFRLFEPKDGVPGGRIDALLTSGDALWIGSNGGLARVANTADDPPRIEIYDSARGMTSDTISCLVEDRQGRIYAGTSNGVDRLDPKTGFVRHFSSGLPHGEFTSAVRDRSGSLWFATKQGLSRLIPAEDRPAVHPRIFITDLRVGGEPYEVSQVGETRLSRLELEPSQNQLQVEFVGLDYEPGDILRYSYRLEGADSGWSPPRSQVAVNYAALAPGKYRFLVKAVTPEGVESAPPAEIDFAVLPAVWRRWWFEALAAALAAALVLAAHRYRVTHIVNLERMRTAIATDLHDDIGASLSQIAVLSEVARAGVKDENPRTQDSLQRVAALAREMVDSLGDIVWSIRAVPDSLDSLTARMREFGLDLLGGQGIAFELRSPPAGQDGHVLSLQARRHLFLVFKECIHNISRHSGCTAARAEIKVEGREILLTVSDNGRGLEPAGAPIGARGGNGIPGMRHRAEALGGSIQLFSKPGEGCTVSLRLPLRRPYLFE